MRSLHEGASLVSLDQRGRWVQLLYTKRSSSDLYIQTKPGGWAAALGELRDSPSCAEIEINLALLEQRFLLQRLDR
jgi:hypothetical protein